MNTIDWENLPLQTTPLNKTMLKQFQDNINNGKVDKSLPNYAGDLNDIDETGYVWAGSNATNKPEIGFSFIVNTVKYSTSYKTQSAIKVSSSGEATEYQRVAYQGVWKDWLLTSEISGTWTPELNTRENIKPTTTYTTQTGSYKKMGNMVFISFYLRGKITALNGTNNYAAIGGLPFTPKTYNMGECSLSTGVSYNLLTTTDAVQMVLNRSYSGMLYVNRNNGAGAGILKVSGDTDFQIGGSGWYETA